MTMDGVAGRVPVPVLVVERDGTVVEANDAAASFFGAAGQPGSDLAESVSADPDGAVDALLEASGERVERVSFELASRVATCDVTVTPVADGVELVVNTHTAERQYVELFETISDPIYMLDEDGVVITVNDALAEEYGYDREEIVGSHVSTFMPEQAVERGREGIEHILTSDDDTARVEFQGTSVREEERWAEVVISVLTGDDGEFQGSVGVLRDITERKARERELADMETVAETAPVGMFTVDENGTFTWGNRQLYERFDMTQDELIGTRFAEFIDRGYIEFESVDRYLDLVPVLLSDDNDVDRVDHEEVIHPPGAGDVYVEAHTSLLPLDENGEFTGTVNAFRDITQRKEYRQELERQNERLESFASLVSHDLRNPLNVAFGHLADAKSRYPEDESLTEVGVSLERMGELIDELLALARQGETVGETEVVSLADVAREAWSTVETPRATLTVETDARVEGDRGRLRQLFENLFRNAIEHGVETAEVDAQAAVEQANGGREAISVTVDATADGFFVADDGRGLQADLDLFELGVSESEDGTGLGLAIVEEIANAHGWSVAASESAPGGARFDVTGVTLLDPAS